MLISSNLAFIPFLIKQTILLYPILRLLSHKYGLDESLVIILKLIEARFCVAVFFESVSLNRVIFAFSEVKILGIRRPFFTYLNITMRYNIFPFLRLGIVSSPFDV